MTSESRPAAGLKAVPVAVWAVVGALALATAGLTGALVARSTDAPPAIVADTSTPDTSAVKSQTQLAPMAAQLQPALAAQAETAPAAKPAPVRVARPAPAPRPVQQVAQAPVQQPAYTPVETTRAAICASCGTIESVHAIQEQGQGTGLGAVAGGIAGGLLGNQVGGGNGKKLMTVVGAVGGGFAGHEVEKRARATTAYDVRVRMEDGSLRTFRRAEPVAVGTRVTVDGGSFRVGGPSSGSTGLPARPIHVSQPA